MKKRVFLNALISFPIGIAAGQIISIVISLIYGGKYYSCPPQLISDVGSEMGAVVLQTILCGIVGAGLGGGTVWCGRCRSGVFSGKQPYILQLRV